MPLNRTGTQGGAFQPQPQQRSTGDSEQLSETIIPGNAVIGNAAGAIPICTQVYTLTKGSAAAITLTAPNTAQSGTVIMITAGSAFAHVVTATGLIQDGVTGGAKTTITLGAFVGASITLMASQLKWNVLAINVAPVT